MVDILKLVGMYIGAFLLLGYCLALLFVLLIAAVYSVGYLYDSIVGDSLYKLGKYIAKKNPKIKEIKVLRRIKCAIEPREQFTRYETPLCTYCFSYTAILFIYVILDSLSIRYGGIVAFFLYILIYFIGMYRRYKGNERYGVVLENNMEFLKLSFTPLAFLVTIVGFIFTISGFNLQQVDFEYFMPIVNSIEENGLVSGVANELWLAVKCGIAIFVLLYVVSIPMQLVSYFVILVIKYFNKYGSGYKKIIGFFLKTWRSFRQ